ncbi:MAG TPA: CHAT domain-containing tetratricopeptide repeat protein [Thermoanaerobaculia bacterium]
MAGQASRDIALTLSDARGRQLLRVDSLTVPNASPVPPEEIHWVADESGDVRIDLTLLAGRRGPCDLRLAERRPATAADRQRALAEVKLARAHKLRREAKLAPELCRTAVPLYESAQRGFGALDLPRRRAEALLGLGQLERECLDHKAAALEAYGRARLLAEGDPHFEAFVLQQLGQLRFDSGSLDRAIDEDRRALALYRRLGDRFSVARTASNLGDALYLQGRYDEAAAHLDEALAVWKPWDYPGNRAQTLLNRGHVHRQFGEWKQARVRFNAALQLFRLANDRDDEAATLTALGVISLDIGRPAAGIKPLQAALRLRPPGSRGLAVTLNTLGAVERQLGRRDEAGREYREALTIFQKLGDSREQALCLGNLGRLEAAGGKLAAAANDLDRALALFRKLADPSDMAWVLGGEAWVLSRRGDLAAARQRMEEALAAIEQVRFRQATYATRAAFFATRQGEYDFLIDLMMEMHEKAPTAGHDAAALEVAERSLARSLLDGLSARALRLGRGGAAPELHARERELETEIEVLVARTMHLRLTEAGGAPAQVQPVEAELRRSWDELDRVRDELRTGDPRYAALTQPRPASVADIQRELLDRDTLLLEYRLAEKESFVWAVTPDSLRSFRLPGRAEIERAAGPVVDLLARSFRRKAWSSAGPQLAELSRLLLGPVATLLPGKRLLIVGNGILQSVPFAALPEPGEGSGGGEPLVARHEIVALPSVSVLREIRRAVAGRPPAARRLWVLAAPEFAGRFPELRYSKEEAQAILALAPATELTGVEASRAAVVHGDLREYSILHFATHGWFTGDEPDGGRRVLAQVDARGRREANGFLHLADIYGLDLRAELVVLSACRSALGREVGGEGMMGMTRGFFYAGAERVLVSLWNVDEAVTVELMRRFYRGLLAEGRSPAAALRLAQNAIREQQGWEAPYYWAGFTLQGEWR